MSPFNEQTVVRRAAGALASSLLALCAAGAHAQAADWQSSVPACVPADPGTLANTQIAPPTFAFVRAPFGPGGPNPPPYTYLCNVLDSYAVVSPAWNWLQLQFNSPVAGSVTAQLFSKNKVTGAVAPVALVANPASGGVAVAQVPVPPLNFAINAYYVAVTLLPQPNFRVQAHMVTLAQ